MSAVSTASQIDPVERRREQRGWYWYDFANSAFVTTTATVLAGPYITAVAKTAACGTDEGDSWAGSRGSRPDPGAEGAAESEVVELDEDKWISTLDPDPAHDNQLAAALGELEKLIAGQKQAA